MSQIHLAYAVIVSITLVAAVTDHRTGLIPNWLTLSALGIAFAGHTLSAGAQGLILAALGMLVCGATPLLFHRLGAMGGGDVKLFAALGALGGPSLGLEIQLLSLTSVLLFGLCAMAWRGQLTAALTNVLRVVWSLVWPAARKRAPEARELTSVRIGAAIFAGSLIAVGNHALFGGLVP